MRKNNLQGTVNSSVASFYCQKVLEIISPYLSLFKRQYHVTFPMLTYEILKCKVPLTVIVLTELFSTETVQFL